MAFTVQSGPPNWGYCLDIAEPTSPRIYYPPARVVKLNFGSDAVARLAEVETASGNLICPVVKLTPVLHASNSD